MFVSLKTVIAAPDHIKERVRDAEPTKTGQSRGLENSVSAAAARRTGQPVRRRSHLAGREGVFWRGIKRRDAWQIVTAAKRYDEAGKEFGKRNGPLGHVALQVIDLLANTVDYRTGRLDPSIEFLMQKTRRCRAAIVRALAALRAHGFLEWMRRYVPAESEGGRGPQVRQTSNAYRLSLPERARRLLGRLVGLSPVPEDFTHRREAQAAQIDAYMATLSIPAQLALKFEDDGMARSFAVIWEGIQRRKERESAKQTESALKSLSKGR